LGLRLIRHSRLQINITKFPGGLLNNNSIQKLWAIVVYKNSDINSRFVIVNKDLEKYPSYLARLKKSMNEQGISSRTKLIFWDNNVITNEFQNIINPTMEDYNPAIQEQLSGEFLQSELIKHNISPIIIEEEVNNTITDVEFEETQESISEHIDEILEEEESVEDEILHN
jgi:glutathionyl-hydroquinone reductase